jgi:hypothetical protein
MNKIVKTLAAVILGSVITSTSAIAGPATDALSACLADNTTGKDRKDMARWVFVGMASHPEIKNLSNVTDANRDELDRIIAALFTKLVTERCPVQAKLAMEKDGNAAFQAAFGIIGQLAMQELMSNPNVNSSFSKFSRYIDQNKMSSTFSKK